MSLRIEIVKRADGVGILRCTRPDGSVTWQKLQKHAAHFALHDLTHYAVETSLGYRHGFFGLIAQGWDMDDTTGKGTRGKVPAEAVEVETVVGAFDSERRMGAEFNLDEFKEYCQRPLTQAEVDRVRGTRAELFRRWAAVAPGDKLELAFPA
jgi:hypothetical protein